MEGAAIIADAACACTGDATDRATNELVHLDAAHDQRSSDQSTSQAGEPDAMRT